MTYTLMKIALGIICIMIALLVMLQSCAISSVSALAQDEQSFGAGAAGILTGLLIFVAGAFAFGMPKVSVGILIVAGLLASLAATDIPDMGIWAVITFGLAVLGYFAVRQDKKAASGNVTATPATSEKPDA